MNGKKAKALRRQARAMTPVEKMPTVYAGKKTRKPKRDAKGNEYIAVATTLLLGDCFRKNYKALKKVNG